MQDNIMQMFPPKNDSEGVIRWGQCQNSPKWAALGVHGGGRPHAPPAHQAHCWPSTGWAAATVACSVAGLHVDGPGRNQTGAAQMA